MIHTIKIKDSSLSRKRLIKYTFIYRKAIKFEDPNETGTPPKGYMTGEEFWGKMDKEIDDICREYGLLK